MTDNAQQTQPEFVIQRIYTKDISFETPNSPEIFQQEWKPEVQMDLNIDNKELSEGIYEITLSITVTAKIADKTAFLCEVQQAGIFTLANMQEQQLVHAINAFCPNILFPYARETVSDLVNKGSFPQLNLAPINFDALFAQQMQQQEAKEQEKTH